MARTIGAAATPAALMDDIVTAAVAQGWTNTQRYTEADNSWDTQVLQDPAGFYFYLATDGTDIYMELSKTHTPSAAWSAIPNKAGRNAHFNYHAFPLTSHAIFASATEIHVATQNSISAVDSYSHLSFGTIEKLDAGSWTGGEYVACTMQGYASFGASNSANHTVFGKGNNGNGGSTYYGGMIRCEGLGAGNDYALFNNNQSGFEFACDHGGGALYGGAVSNHGYASGNQPNTFNQRVRYWPITISITDNGTNNPTGTNIPLGYVKNVRRVCNKLLTPKEADPANPTWYVFQRVCFLLLITEVHQGLLAHGLMALPFRNNHGCYFCIFPT